MANWFSWRDRIPVNLDMFGEIAVDEYGKVIWFHDQMRHTSYDFPTKEEAEACYKAILERIGCDHSYEMALLGNSLGIRPPLLGLMERKSCSPTNNTLFRNEGRLNNFP